MNFIQKNMSYEFYHYILYNKYKVFRSECSTRTRFVGGSVCMYVCNTLAPLPSPIHLLPKLNRLHLRSFSDTFRYAYKCLTYDFWYAAFGIRFLVWRNTKMSFSVIYNFVQNSWSFFALYHRDRTDDPCTLL